MNDKQRKTGKAMKMVSLTATLVFSIWLLSLSAPISAQMPVPPRAEQFTADCNRPVFASDHLVCEDRELREMDLRLANALTQTAALSTTDYVENNVQWFKRRSLCAFETEHRNCLASAYQDRLAIIEGISTTPARSLVAKCKSLGRVSLDVASSGPMFLRISSTGELIAAASAPSDKTIWKPMLSFSKRGSIIDFTSQNGRKFSCKVKS